jgi:hypothetical protein
MPRERAASARADRDGVRSLAESSRFSDRPRFIALRAEVADRLFSLLPSQERRQASCQHRRFFSQEMRRRSCQAL